MSSTYAIEFRSAVSRKRRAFTVASGMRYSIGSNPENDIVLADAGVLGYHAHLIISDEGSLVEPVNGSPVSLNSQPLSSSAQFSDADWLALGQALYQIRTTGDIGLAVAQQSLRPHGTGQPDAVSIGRSEECDLVIPSPVVSGLHARLLAEETGDWVLEDLESSNGTFVNGQAISERTPLCSGDRVAFASFAFIFTGDKLQPANDAGKVSIEVRDLYKEVKDRSNGQPKRLLDHINLVIEPGEFVGIFGTSGSGKSTLLDALNGRRQASGGEVRYNGTSLNSGFDLFRAAIGYVPQQDIVHRKITVGNALRYTARLRLPADTSETEIENYIVKVLDQVGLSDKTDSPIDTPAPLSGGQLKRVSLAVELIANPTLLFLDEVTSGLDAGTDKKMMDLFGDLAAGEKTVVCITHTLENIDACDLVVLLHQGRLVYYGPPASAPAYFGIDKLTDVYELLDSSPAENWADQFEGSELYDRYISERRSDAEITDAPVPSATPPVNVQRDGFQYSQMMTLTHRYLDLLVSDRRNLAILLLQAPLIALIIGLVFKIDGPIQAQASSESQISFLLILSAIWFGCLNASRELVKELPIYLRERSVNLGIGPYLFSKLLPLAVLCLIQCIILLSIIGALVPLSGSLIEKLTVIFVAGMSATTMGLTVSALVDTNDKAIATIPILLIPQVVLSNAIAPLDGIGEAVAKASMISYWSFDAIKATLPQELLSVKRVTGELIVPVIGNYGTDLVMVVVFSAIFVLTAFLGLKLKDRRT